MLFDTAVLVLPVTNKTVLYSQKGTSNSSHIPQPAVAGLGFAPNGANAPCFLRKTSTHASRSLRMTEAVAVRFRTANPQGWYAQR